MTTFPACALVILDGWGLAPPGPGNAVDLADTPVFDDLMARYPNTTLTACGEAVGLPPGQMGNSEVGHLNLGAGAIVKQDLVRINESDFADKEALVEAMKGAPRVHLVGLVSDGGVHASMEHLERLVKLGRDLGVEDLVIHAFTDGRDTSPTSGAGFLTTVDAMQGARVGSVLGRYFGMDRDNREERTATARALLVDAVSEHHAPSGEQAVRDAYDRDETDEFITATTVGDEAKIRPEDRVITFNFRPDRMRQIVTALAESGAMVTTLTEYEEGWPYAVAFPPARPTVTLATVIAGRGEKQLHVAETEKYPHVTYFFNGGEEEAYDGERRELVPSPRDVPTYDFKPEMSARGAADAFIAAWTEDAPRFGIINFANPDMVGHTGSIPAAIKACEAVDACLGDVVKTVLDSGGVLIVTADHGNADEMLEDDGSPDTAHSLNPVPLVVTSEEVTLDGEGILADVAPTVLALVGIEQPPEMTGRSLLG
ncbi:MAG: 2,3-bisphosphoglycerate-independent phosphoglycerate mutase [uncultured Solirubrobacteraceae bacterium]|uniref:2,3-bisphosphoglycerate-independent phosphoglycerate mutase n=1 Tax=uncultured Solirubrobacteraceae bacterium TaxID=1162706 RepID=A0A6J4SMT5_9ACTN|nr:MAG: 2,3-bisphosphoglycerate-independent phosphoglycerate mutase [uncultured Solirubrobacteraceae bacterium]